MDTICAIPTEYNGRKYRSRLEADTARLLDALSIPFTYELESFLLSNNQHYRPDFLLRTHPWLTVTKQGVADLNDGKPIERPGLTYLEVRGYRSEKGASQLVTFAADLASGLIPSAATFSVLSGDAPPVAFSSYRGSWTIGNGLNAEFKTIHALIIDGKLHLDLGPTPLAEVLNIGAL